MTAGLAINLDASCWIFAGCKDRAGYGMKRRHGKTCKAHRVMWELMRGPIPVGLSLDHLCRNRACINPLHLEPVTHRENVLRGESPTAKSARRNNCLQGHSYDKANTYWFGGARYCRICKREYDRKRYRQSKAIGRDWHKPYVRRAANGEWRERQR